MYNYTGRNIETISTPLTVTIDHYKVHPVTRASWPANDAAAIRTVAAFGAWCNC